MDWDIGLGPGPGGRRSGLGGPDFLQTAGVFRLRREAANLLDITFLGEFFGSGLAVHHGSDAVGVGEAGGLQFYLLEVFEVSAKVVVRPGCDVRVQWTK